ncbi:hypothetical protein JVT61DRAFT_11076 [Boletus reticuloceps]|uniref:Uncharacterized protein n=1 Tax=Boletus reticuloceps TaxID=495285 RepID=A0A8I2YF00_9AGAM|nr:hypothetical protein JVT61DRAFT_11076 [Boletus reticuloceps]
MTTSMSPKKRKKTTLNTKMASSSDMPHAVQATAIGNLLRLTCSTTHNVVCSQVLLLPAQGSPGHAQTVVCAKFAANLPTPQTLPVLAVPKWDMRTLQSRKRSGSQVSTLPHSQSSKQQCQSKPASEHVFQPSKSKIGLPAPKLSLDPIPEFADNLDDNDLKYFDDAPQHDADLDDPMQQDVEEAISAYSATANDADEDFFLNLDNNNDKHADNSDMSHDLALDASDFEDTQHLT